jgi:hypothetical protein
MVVVTAPGSGSFTSTEAGESTPAREANRASPTATEGTSRMLRRMGAVSTKYGGSSTLMTVTVRTVVADRPPLSVTVTCPERASTSNGESSMNPAPHAAKYCRVSAEK